MASLKFEVDRLNNVMASLKKQYYQVRIDSEKEVIEEDRRLAQEMVMNAQQGSGSGFEGMRVMPNMES